jgi:excisionase family DNA binding protein
MTATKSDASVSFGPGRNQRQVCHALGCSRSTFYVLLGRGEFPNAYFVGASVRVPQSDVDAYRERNSYTRKKEAGLG